MNQPIIGTALPIAAITLITWSALAGNLTELCRNVIEQVNA